MSGSKISVTKVKCNACYDKNVSRRKIAMTDASSVSNERITATYDAHVVDGRRKRHKMSEFTLLLPFVFKYSNTHFDRHSTAHLGAVTLSSRQYFSHEFYPIRMWISASGRTSISGRSPPIRESAATD